jgi:hypothetical protein
VWSTKKAECGVIMNEIELCGIADDAAMEIMAIFNAGKSKEKTLDEITNVIHDFFLC